jgi:hypothetical protein
MLENNAPGTEKHTRHKKSRHAKRSGMPSFPKKHRNHPPRDKNPRKEGVFSPIEDHNDEGLKLTPKNDVPIVERHKNLKKRNKILKRANQKLCEKWSLI